MTDFDTYKVGIDPGLTGAIALLARNGEKLLGVVDMPIFADGKHQQINAVALFQLMESWRRKYDIEVYLEQVSAMPGQGVSSMFNFGTGYGIIMGVVSAMQLPLILVRPQAWKKRAGLLHSEKDQARTMAQRLYPTAELSRKKDIGRADAILIARFGENHG